MTAIKLRTLSNKYNYNLVTVAYTIAKVQKSLQLDAKYVVHDWLASWSVQVIIAKWLWSSSQQTGISRQWSS